MCYVLRCLRGLAALAPEPLRPELGGFEALRVRGEEARFGRGGGLCRIAVSAGNGTSADVSTAAVSTFAAGFGSTATAGLPERKARINEASIGASIGTSTLSTNPAASNQLATSANE